MPFLLVIGAAYAAYQANAKREKIRIDPAINIAGKTAIKLHELERELSILELPISSVSFYEGDYKQAAAHLERRCEAILQANPWLAGWLLPIPDLQILYDPRGQDRPPGTFQVFEPGRIALKHSTPYELHSEMISEAIVASSDQLVGQNLPLWRVSIIPDAGAWESKFAVVVSMSHAIGDAHTYYKFFNMLHCEATVEAMNPIRVPQFRETVRDLMGRSESIFVENILSSVGRTKNSPIPPLNPTEEIVRELAFEATQSHPTTPSTEKSALLQSFQQLKIAKLEEVNVIKMFYINEEWVTRRKGRRGSVFDADISTSPSEYTTSTTLTANSIIASWFFRMNDACLGIVMMNMRDRLGDRCAIDSNHAGNYVHALVCANDDVSSPSGVQNAVQTMNRQTPLDQLNLDTNRNSSLCTNWANFYHDDLKLAENCHQTVHLPIYNTAILRYLPGNISALNIFTARCAGDGQERRAGAFVICRETVWEEIKNSGIIAEMIVEM